MKPLCVNSLSLPHLWCNCSSGPLGKLGGGGLSGLHAALSAVNLAECSGDRLTAATLARIHVCAALGLKAGLPRGLRFAAVSAGSV